MPSQPPPEEIKARALERRQRAIAAFPFERVEAAGNQAFATWVQCRRAGRGYPVVLGDDESVANLAIPFNFPRPDNKSVEEIIALSTAIRHPEDLAAKRTSERQKS